MVEQIKADGRHEHRVHREVYRPWGKYDSIDAGDRYQVKRITVKPGEACRYRCTITVRNTGWLSRERRPSTVISNCLVKTEFIYSAGGDALPGKPGKIPLDLIEVRSGSYLEEDDVVRFADRYG
ncbi:hypothetical protein ACLB1R_05520 [Escherichia coli]